MMRQDGAAMGFGRSMRTASEGYTDDKMAQLYSAGWRDRRSKEDQLVIE